MGPQNGVRWLKPDLKTIVDRVDARPGDVLVVRPKDRFSKFTDEYVAWLQQTLQEVLPPGVRGMILADDSTEFVRLRPEFGHRGDSGDDGDLQGAFEHGWGAAFDALERFHTQGAT